jgi:hypothetical protein
MPLRPQSNSLNILSPANNRRFIGIGGIENEARECTSSSHNLNRIAISQGNWLEKNAASYFRTAAQSKAEGKVDMVNLRIQNERQLSGHAEPGSFRISTI